MGKAGNQQLPVVQQSHGSSASGTFLCHRCTMGFYRLFSFKCALILIFSVAAFLSTIFWVIPHRHKQVGFDARDSVKISATVQSYFQLQKPVAELVPYIARLQYDVNEEIGVPSLKIAVLSMHQAELSNWTDVVFGFLPDPINSTANPVALSLLKSSLIDLFLQRYNLTLTSSIFGEPSSFEITKFPDGITIMPEGASMISQTLFNFTLNSSINDIKENLPELKEQLKLGLHLMPNEVVHVQVSNKHGSTKNPPVTVEASVATDLGSILPERLRQLAQTINGSPPTENLGLDHSVFGKVKEISLSSFLKHSLQAPAPTPTPSPSPSPEQIHDTGPSMMPSYSPAFSPNSHHSLPPSSNCYTSEPSGAPSPQNAAYRSSSPISDSPASPAAQGSEHCGSTDPPSPSPTSHPDQMSPKSSPYYSSGSPLAVPTPQISPARPPFAGVAYGSHDPDDKGLVSPLHVSSSSKYTYSAFIAGTGRTSCFYLNGLLSFLLLLGIYPQ